MTKAELISKIQTEIETLSAEKHTDEISTVLTTLIMLKQVLLNKQFTIKVKHTKDFSILFYEIENKA